MQEMGIKFKHLGIVAWSGTLRNLVFKFLKIQNSLENHETWHGVISWHQHVVVKKLSAFGQVFGISFLQTQASLKKAHGSEMERATFECETIYAASPLIFFTNAT